MTDYQEVIRRYKDVDLYGMTDEEYKALKEAEFADMKFMADSIASSDVPEVMYRIGRPITDLKMMMESGADTYGWDKVLYHQIMPGDDHFTEFSYGQVRDDVRAYGLLIEKGEKGETYNVGSGKAVAIQDILDLILSKSTAKINVEVDPAKIRPVDVPIIEADTTKIYKTTGWKTEIPLDQTSEETLNYWREKIDE